MAGIRQSPRAQNAGAENRVRSRCAFPRQALHAGVLGFFHPTRQTKLRFESPWPQDFSKLVNALRGLKAVRPNLEIRHRRAHISPEWGIRLTQDALAEW
jgi:hypothetical protein